MSKTEHQQYSSFNSLSRRPLIFGIPIVALVFGVILMVASGFFGVSVFGNKGLVLPVFFLLGLIYIRIRCTLDSRAMEDIKWEVLGFLTKIRCQSSIISFSSIDETEERRAKDVTEWFKNNTSDEKNT